jgi:hypothetical protein
MPIFSFAGMKAGRLPISLSHPYHRTKISHPAYVMVGQRWQIYDSASDYWGIGTVEKVYADIAYIRLDDNSQGIALTKFMLETPSLFRFVG